jgi:hypothetical protein
MYHRLNVHVYASDKEVLRAVRARLKPIALTRKFRRERHAIFRRVLLDHRKARALVRRFRL